MLYWDADFIQTADINATGSGSWNNDAGYSPIGNSTIKFTGIYNGQGHCIDFLRINRPSENYIGLFGYISSGEVYNLGIAQAVIYGNWCVGGLVGCSSASIISNCYNKGHLYGNSLCGGLVGVSIGESSISNCYTDSRVFGELQTSYIFDYVVAYTGKMFYQVITLKDYSKKQLDYLLELNDSKEKILWKDVKKELHSIQAKE